MLGCKKNIMRPLVLLTTWILCWEAAATDGVETEVLENWGASSLLKKREISPEKKRKAKEARRKAEFKKKSFQSYRYQSKKPKIPKRPPNLPQTTLNYDYNPNDDDFNEGDSTISTLEIITNPTQRDEANDLMVNHLNSMEPIPAKKHTTDSDEDDFDGLDGFIGSFSDLIVSKKR